MNRDRIEHLLRSEPAIWAKIAKCGREPAIMESMEQLKFKLAWHACRICPETIEKYLPKDLYADFSEMMTVRTWLQFLSSDDQRVLNVLQCGISQGAKFCKLTRSTYYVRVQAALDKLSELLAYH
ncbi:MAG: hypothetical protein PHV32_16875 [Eubacteriales bacterium]|nr:hypothetical protein [Eubacteriales bacterium]